MPGTLPGVPDSTILPDPSTDMYEFYEGLDQNLFSESTGINHNASSKWLRSEVARQLDFLSYILQVKNEQTILSNNIVHTDSIIDDNVTQQKLSPALRDIILNSAIFNVTERNSVQTVNAISATGSDAFINVTADTIISQAGGFDVNGQVDSVELLASTSITQTVGETLTGYLYKVVGGNYSQYTTEQNVLNADTMIGTKVLLGTFKVDVSGNVYDVVPAVPTTTVRDLNITGRGNGTGFGQYLGDAPVKAVAFVSNSTNEDLVVASGTNAFAIDNITIEAEGSITVEDDAVFKIL